MTSIRVSRVSIALGALSLALVVAAPQNAGAQQGGGQNAAGRPVARPPAIPKSGPVPREPNVEQKLQAQFKAPDGFKVTLFAGPPVAMYPTCVAESPDGAVFVCVDPNLSLSTLKGVGRVMRLVDSDDDGRADRYTTFAEMDSPRGIVSDGRSVYVMHPPNLTAYRDTNGDGIADTSTVLVTGLGFDLDFRGADHTTNNIRMGPDGWLYVAVGDYGFMKAVGADGKQIQNRGGAVVRVRPDGTNLEIVAVGQRNIYDVAIDPLNRLYARDNTNDGDGWNTRLHYMPAGARHGYPSLYRNFPTEHFPFMADYGGGSGVGALWLQDPAWPAAYNNTLLTADWTVQKIFRHPLTPKGGNFAVQQEDFISVLRPADLTLDGNSNLYVASLSAGQFTYNSDTVGYVVQVRSGTAKPSREANVFRATDAALLATLGSANFVHRMHAQQELLRRGPKPAIVRGLERTIANQARSTDARTMAIFTLKQLVGAKSHVTLARASTSSDARVREAIFHAMADRTDQLQGTFPSMFAKALHDSDGQIKVQAIRGLVRLGARDQAHWLLPSAGGDDQAISHLAVQALVSLRASDAALRAVDGTVSGPGMTTGTATPAIRTAALRALAQMHEPAVVNELVQRVGRATDPAARRELLRTLARLHHREAEWKGDWWTTKPAFAGPYFDPAAWEESPRIRPTLSSALLAATGAEFDSLVVDYAANQVLPRGAQPLLAAVTRSRDPQRAQLIEALVGRTQLDGPSIALATQLDAKSPELHGAVAQLLAGESTLGANSLLLARTAVLDPKLEPQIRGTLLTAMSQAPGQSSLDVAAEVFARLNPVPGLPAVATPAAAASASPTAPAGAAAAAGDPVEVAWRRFVGDRRRAGELDYFITMARTSQPSQRTLAYAVLLQSIRTPRTPAAVREKVAPVVEAAWSDAASTPSLVQAISLMRLESQYADKLTAYNQRSKK